MHHQGNILPKLRGLSLFWFVQNLRFFILGPIITPAMRLEDAALQPLPTAPLATPCNTPPRDLLPPHPPLPPLGHIPPPPPRPPPAWCSTPDMASKTPSLEWGEE